MATATILLLLLIAASANDWFHGCDGCSDFYVCTACNPGFYKWQGSNLCREFCPLGYHPDPETMTCIGTSRAVLRYDFTQQTSQRLWDIESGVLAVLGSTVVTDETIPTPVAGQGLFFNQRAGIRGAIPFLLNTSFTISTWTKPLDRSLHLPLFSKNSNEMHSVSLELSQPPPHSIRNVLLSYSSGQMGSTATIFDQAVDIDKWCHIAVTFDYLEPMTSTKVFINGMAGSLHASLSMVYDDFFNFHIGFHNEKYYKGIIRDLAIHNYALTDMSQFFGATCQGHCSYCPQNGLCFVGDRLPSAWVDWNWNIHPCGDRCESCNSNTACMACRANSVPKLGTNSCECPPGQGWNGDECVTCYSHCAQWTFSKACTLCTTGSYMWKSGNFCREICPFGTVPLSGMCLGPDAIVIDLEFETHSGVLIDQANGIRPMIQGLDQPIPTRERGWYFGGMSHLEFPNSRSSATSEGIVFDTDFTIVFWLKLDKDSGKSVGLLHKFAPKASSLLLADAALLEQDVLRVYLQESATYPFDRQVKFQISESVPGNTHNGISLNQIKDDQWAYLAIKCQFIGSHSIVNLQVNRSNESLWLYKQRNEGNTTNTYGPIMDDPSNSFLLGTQGFDTKNQFIGFMKQFKLYNYAQTELLPISHGLSNCRVDQYVERDGTCHDCQPSCSSCVRGDTCSLCVDQLCVECAYHFDGQCATCSINAASNAQGNCEWDFGYIYDLNSCFFGTCGFCTPFGSI